MTRFAQQPIEEHMNIYFKKFGYLKYHIRDKIHYDLQKINTKGIDLIYNNEWQYI